MRVGGRKALLGVAEPRLPRAGLGAARAPRVSAPGLCSVDARGRLREGHHRHAPLGVLHGGRSQGQLGKASVRGSAAAGEPRGAGVAARARGARHRRALLPAGGTSCRSLCAGAARPRGRLRAGRRVQGRLWLPCGQGASGPGGVPAAHGRQVVDVLLAAQRSAGRRRRESRRRAGGWQRRGEAGRSARADARAPPGARRGGQVPGPPGRGPGARRARPSPGRPQPDRQRIERPRDPAAAASREGAGGAPGQALVPVLQGRPRRSLRLREGQERKEAAAPD
mmetsp:Transcript_96578/g.288295  ORF Transcript_96578/g.288295 Transcript_96578/m.288295 type:complete len:281 (+) Transcript_96578:1729-2571(+)